MGQVNPGKYDGFEVEGLANGRTRITVGKDSTVFNASGKVSRDQTDGQAGPAEPHPEETAPEEPKTEKSWTAGIRTR